MSNKYNSRKKSNLYFIIFIAILVLVFVYYFWSVEQPGNLDSFASCLKEKGVEFYGAWWCPHCQNQKKLFGNSVKLLPYVECYIEPDANNQLQVCKDKNITGYPTWIFADGSILSGEISIATLSEKTGCSASPDATPSSNILNSNSPEPTVLK
ncbi:MAG: thioredoxin domain-containing protein [bacterium]|nr:thioredoxin domain-containing protein [bacterium]